MTKLSPIDFKPELVSTMKLVLEAAAAHIDSSSGKPQTYQPGHKSQNGIPYTQIRRRWSH